MSNNKFESDMKHRYHAAEQKLVQLRSSLELRQIAASTLESPKSETGSFSVESKCHNLSRGKSNPAPFGPHGRPVKNCHNAGGISAAFCEFLRILAWHFSVVVERGKSRVWSCCGTWVNVANRAKRRERRRLATLTVHADSLATASPGLFFSG